MQPGCRPFSVSGKATPASRVRSRVAAGLGVVEESRHVSKQCAREPGDLQSVCASRPVREGERPHDPDMNVLEESDCAIVPMKLTNNEGKTSAEPAEGRAQTKENVAQPHTHPTQSGARVSQGLGGVRQAARDRKQERFSALLHHLTIDLLRESYYALQRSASPGVDGVSWQQYEQGRAVL
jgi:RNA-directed DNA polymerase